MTRILAGFFFIGVFAAALFFGSASTPPVVVATTIAAGWVGFGLLVSGFNRKLRVVSR